jgi:hypothetical protein
MFLSFNFLDEGNKLEIVNEKLKPDLATGQIWT